MTTKLDAFESETDPYRRNRLLFGWLCDDDERLALYEELEGRKFEVLRLKSVVRQPDDTAPWPCHDLHVVSGREDVAYAMRKFSVEPYSELDSPDHRFMLGLDDPTLHGDQKRVAMAAMDFEPKEIQATAKEAARQACILPFKTRQFDLVTGVAQQAALRFTELLFGMQPESHVYLELGMDDTYRRLSFKIVGRHFVSDSGLQPLDSAQAVDVKNKLGAAVAAAATATRDPDLVRKGLSEQTVISRLFAGRGEPGGSDPVLVALGLMAGTVGNLTSAISIAIDHFFRGRDRDGSPLMPAARAAAQDEDRTALERLIQRALWRRPAAPFLTRVARGNGAGDGGTGARSIPDGALVLLALGADPHGNLAFGWDEPPGDYAHRCPGQVFVSPLVTETVRQVLRLPGLSRVISPQTGRPIPLAKTWGAVCETLPLQYQRDLRLNQQPLHVSLPIKEPVAENAKVIEQITQAGAQIVEDALAKSRHVHFAWFNFDDSRTHLCMSTAFDGDFDTYVEFFALLVPLFDVQFQYLKVDLPGPIRDFPKEFVAAIRKHSRDPIAGFFFSAYPLLTVSDIDNMGGE